MVFLCGAVALPFIGSLPDLEQILNDDIDEIHDSLRQARAGDEGHPLIGITGTTTQSTPRSAQPTEQPTSTASMDGYLPLLLRAGLGTARATTTSTPINTPSATSVPTPRPTNTVIPTATPTQTPVSCLSTEEEPNNSFTHADAQPLLCRGTTLTGYLPTDDQRDVYRIRVERNPVVVDLTNIPSGTDYDLFLYDATRQLRAESREEGQHDERIQIDLPAGTYYVDIFAYRGRSDESYRLSWH